MTGEGARETVGPRDRAVISGELGRQPHDLTGIAVRCPFGYPAVVETAPILSDGAPNPTLLYLTCPVVAAAVSRVESAGAVRRMRAACLREGPLRRLLLEVTDLYRGRRADLVGGEDGSEARTARLGAGIGGPEGPEVASCLHAYAAALLAVATGWLSAPPERNAELQAEARKAWERFLPPLGETWCRDKRCARWDIGQRRAAIDVGTMSVRLLVADVIDGRPWTVVRRAEMTRMGEGLRPGARLGEAARRRTAATVAQYVQEARSNGVYSMVLAGTSAARDALDGEEFIHDLGQENALPSVVLSGIREAELAYIGVCLDLESGVVVIDVGGGSTELMCRAKTGAVQAVSLEIGAGRATERWVASDPPTAGERSGIYQESNRYFRRVRRQLGAGPPGRVLVGVAGTVTTLAALDAGLEEYDPDAIHRRTLSLEAVQELVSRLGSMNNAERAALPCVQAARAPIIVAGAVIVQAAMETLAYESMTVSERDMLDGLLVRGA